LSAVRSPAAATLPIMATAGTTYPISRSTGVCAATGRTFAEGEPFVATLVEREGQPLLERVDFAVSAWETGQRPQAPLRLFGFWKGTHREHESARQPLLGDAELLDLFEELGAATEPKQVTFRYLLSLLLVRRRVLRVVGTRRDSAGTIMLVIPKGAEGEGRTPIEVVDPGMDDGAVADAIEQLGQVVATDPAAPRGQG
jgi:hypothetical protein